MLQVMPASAAQLAALAEGDDIFAARFGRAVAPGYCEFPGAAERGLEALWNGDATPTWWTHLFLLPAGDLVGLGGYQGAPDADGTVEIGYCIAPSHRGRGYATSAVQALVRRAFADTRVRCVVAHTQARHGASTRVLERCGFARAFAFYEPGEGSLWRWQLWNAGPDTRTTYTRNEGRATMPGA